MTSARAREQVWQKEEAKGFGHVYCNLCSNEVFPGDDWDVSHVGAPAALGGTDTGVAHRGHNREHGRRFVIPMVAKAKRMWRKHRGIDGPGLGPNAMDGGRRSRITKKLDGAVETRFTQSEKHARTMAEFPNWRGHS